MNRTLLPQKQFRLSIEICKCMGSLFVDNLKKEFTMKCVKKFKQKMYWDAIKLKINKKKCRKVLAPLKIYIPDAVFDLYED